MREYVPPKIVCYDSLLQVPFCEEKRVQLFRVAFFRSDFLQNTYFSDSENLETEMSLFCCCAMQLLRFRGNKVK